MKSILLIVIFLFTTTPIFGLDTDSEKIINSLDVETKTFFSQVLLRYKGEIKYGVREVNEMVREYSISIDEKIVALVACGALNGAAFIEKHDSDSGKIICIGSGILGDHAYYVNISEQCSESDARKIISGLSKE